MVGRFARDHNFFQNFRRSHVFLRNCSFVCFPNENVKNGLTLNFKMETFCIYLN